MRVAISNVSATGVTKGKEYEILMETRISFGIVGDNDGKMYCLKDDCCHLRINYDDGFEQGEWTIIDKE
ncbi:MAG: hypothetical protein DRR06_19065 [Gammaproteobacteria bacterium]|nr:MAG: hypothetical protein DRR06_19065 [Gammaproteobacteria bacterium]